MGLKDKELGAWRVADASGFAHFRGKFLEEMAQISCMSSAEDFTANILASFAENLLSISSSELVV